MRSVFRPIIAIGLGYTLCIMAIVEAFDCGVAPQWFLGLSIPIIVALFGERAYRKNKGE